MPHDLSEFAFMYSVNDSGTITDPGRYEGEPLWAAWFGDSHWIHACEIEFPNWDDEGCEHVAIYRLTDDDRETWADLADEEYIALCHTQDGFVTAWPGSLWSIHKSA